MDSKILLLNGRKISSHPRIIKRNIHVYSISISKYFTIKENYMKGGKEKEREKIKEEIKKHIDTHTQIHSYKSDRTMIYLHMIYLR